ncbi:tyrosine-type recombinase/integrase [Brochothrix campestris]|uniref:tyrosine-type recombinase/integrase n=1 Tax=Brochothrix campestris TaxID=2757 RepID=UPI0038D21544
MPKIKTNAERMKEKIEKENLKLMQEYSEELKSVTEYTFWGKTHYKYSIYAYYNSFTKKRVYLKKAKFKTSLEAAMHLRNELKKANKEKEKIEKSLLKKSGKYSYSYEFNRIFNEVIEEKKEKGLKISTIQKYKALVKNHLSDDFKNKYINLIEPSELDDILVSYEIHKNGIAKQLFSFLSETYKFAFRKGLIENNHLLNYRGPKRDQKRAPVILSDKELRAIETIINNHQDIFKKVYFNILLNTGMRKSEALALSRKSIDLDNKIIHITNSVTYDEETNKAILSSCKTKASERQIPISTTLTDLIREYIEELPAEQDMLFKNKNNELYRPTYVNGWFKTILKQANCQKATVHDIRHTFITRLHQSKQFDIKQIQRYVGHSNTAVTLNTYIHLNATSLVEVSDFMNELTA